tara:strand:+ start:1974 stop:3071 length:1098 start_codon:yes stop_codon:yes gene_type:complete
MKKVLVIVNSFEFIYTHRLDLIKTLQKYYEVSLLCKNNNLLNNTDEFHVIDIDIKNTSMNFLNLLKSSISYFYIILKNKPDLIHVIGLKPIVIFSLFSLFLYNTKTLFSISGIGILSNMKKYKIIKYLIKIYLFIFLRNKNFFIFQNYSDKSFFNILLDKEKNNFSLIYGSGININNYQKIKSFNKDNLKILFASRLLVSKGINFFLDVADFYRNDSKITFSVAGKIETMHPDSMKLSNLNNQTIDYLGFVNNMPNLLSKFDILIFPSFYGEGIPKIILESMASGMLVISSKFNQFENIINHNQTGFMLNIINSSNIINLIEEIKSLDDDKINLISNSAKNFAITNFNVEDVITKHITIYKNLLS